MSQIIGKVGMTPRGMYERTRAYERLDVVTYQGSSWVAIVDVPAQISPALGSDYWQLQARMGETGPQGPVGPQGNSAFDGTGVELVNNLTQGGQTAALSAEQGKILKQELTELESEVGNLIGEDVEIANNRTSALLSNIFIKANKTFKWRIVSNNINGRTILLDNSGVRLADTPTINEWYETSVGYDINLLSLANYTGSVINARIEIAVGHQLLIENLESHIVEVENGCQERYDVLNGRISEVKESTSILTPMEYSNVRQNMIIRHPVAGNPAIFYGGSDISDCYVFNVGMEQEFKVIGKNTNQDSVCCAIVDADPPSSVAPIRLERVDGEFIYVAKTTSDAGVVVVCVDKGVVPSLYLLKSVASEVESLKDAFGTSRKSIYIYTTDSEVAILNKLLTAFNEGSYDVHWQYGKYEFASVYLYMRDTLGWTWTMELPIGNNCRYYFNGSTIISNQPLTEYADSRNVFGCKGGRIDVNLNYELHDVTIINNGGTYCVHDEGGASNKPYIHRYKNVTMEYNSGAASEGLSKCIGGGCGEYGIVDIENCVFTNNHSTEDITWHGIASDTRFTQFKFLVRNTYFKGGMRVGQYFSEDDDVMIIYNNNSAAIPLNVENTIKTIQFLNEVRGDL